MCNSAKGKHKGIDVIPSNDQSFKSLSKTFERLGIVLSVEKHWRTREVIIKNICDRSY